MKKFAVAVFLVFACFACSEIEPEKDNQVERDNVRDSLIIPKSVREIIVDTNSILEQFYRFQESFYTDLLFQRNHTIDTLEGKIIFYDDEQNAPITKNWQEFDLEKIHSFEELMNFHEGIVNELILIDSSFVIERNFVPNSGICYRKCFRKKESGYILYNYLVVAL